MSKYRTARRNMVKVFFHLTCVESKHQMINIVKVVGMIFNAWYGYFEYIGYLSHGIALIFLNVLIWSLSTSTSTGVWSIVQWQISSMRNFTNHSWYIGSSTAPSPCTAHFFAFQFFTFLEIINYNMLKALHFLPSSILKWLHKTHQCW